jgi:actin-related protein
VNDSVATPKYKSVMAANQHEKHYVGDAAEALRGVLRITYPMEHGVIQDWDGMELIWRHVYSNVLRAESMEHPALLTEPPLNPRRNREKMAEIFFEKFRVPAVFFSIQAVLSLYASGRTTGVVLDSGDGVSHCVPVFEGWALPNAVTRVDVAGRDVTNYFLRLLRQGGHAFGTSAEREIVRGIKESLCDVSCDGIGLLEKKSVIESLASLKGTSMSPSAPRTESKVAGEVYVLPDDTRIEIGAERFQAPEILFDPSLVGIECPGVHQCLGNSILMSDIDIRKELMKNVVLSGGSTLFKHYGDRLLIEMRSLFPDIERIKIHAPPERKYSSWMGGSVLASLDTFRSMWVTKSEYEEDPGIIHEKCF